MAYYKKEKQTIITTADKNMRGDKIRVTRVEREDRGRVYVDVRELYTDEDGELRYTTRGVRMESEIATEVIIAMIRALGEDTVQDILMEMQEEIGENNNEEAESDIEPKEDGDTKNNREGNGSIEVEDTK